MWNPFRKIGNWFDAAGNRIAQNQLGIEGPISANDLTPAQKRAYLGMLISSIGSGLSSVGAGVQPNIIGNYLVGQNALSENFVEQIRKKKIQNVLQANLPLEEKVKLVSSLGDVNTAAAIQKQIDAEQEKRTPVSTFQVVNPQTRQVETRALLRDGSQILLGQTPVENMPINTGGSTNILPRYGPVSEKIVNTVSPDAVLSAGIQQARMEQEAARQAEELKRQEAMMKLQEKQIESNIALNKARIASELAQAQATQAKAEQPTAIPPQVQQNLLMHDQVLKNIDEIIQDIDKNGKLSVLDVLGQTPRGQRINTVLQSTVEYLKGPFGTGVLQEHEAKRMADMLGSVNGFMSLLKNKESIMAGLQATKKMISRSISTQLMLMNGQIPPELAAEYQKRLVDDFVKEIGGKEVTVTVDPNTGERRVRR